MMSPGAPGGKDTTILMGLVGHAWAIALEAITVAARMAAPSDVILFIGFMLSPL
jgi:hypothetical protein